MRMVANRIVRKSARIAFLGAAAFGCQCHFITGLFQPFECSTSRLEGAVFDSAYPETAVPGAKISIPQFQRADTTDSQGFFSIDPLPSGPIEVIIEKQGYHTATRRCAVTLQSWIQRVSLQRMNAPPVITHFSASPTKTVTRDQPVTFRFSVYDSTGGIAQARLGSGYDSLQIRLFDPPQLSVTDSMVFKYPSAGDFQPRLVIQGGASAGDSAISVLSVSIANNHSPQLRLIRIQPEGFINGAWGFIEVFAADPDGDFAMTIINWGDGTATDRSTDSMKAFWHKYEFQSDTAVSITIMLSDKNGARRDSVVTPVAVISRIPPRLDAALYYEPKPPLLPTDTAVLIGVRVYQVEGWISEIIWSINPDTPYPHHFFRQKMDAQTGKLEPPGGLFVHRFPTAHMVAVNTVTITVVDKYGNSAGVVGSLLLLGKGDTVFAWEEK